MALTTLAVANYRSLRDVVTDLAPLTLITGPNGSGKSSLYRSLRLLADTAHDRLIASLAAEGGLQSTLWAGPEQISAAMRRGDHPVQGTVRRDVVSLKLGFASEDFGYAIDCGLPVGMDSAFELDPMIKREVIWAGPLLRPATLLVDRRGPSVRVRADGKEWQALPTGVASFDSVISHGIDPRLAPELLTIRERIRGWRFYDHFRSDRDAPARQPQIGTHTPILADDGADLAAAVQTIFEIGDRDAFIGAIDDAFPGGEVSIDIQQGRFEMRLRQPGLLRPLRSAELSDGTLRYLLWVAALLTPRPPELLVLNEPETSLHPDLLPALGRLIAGAASRSQLVVVTHATRLIAALTQEPHCQHVELDKDFGETRCNAGRAERPRWEWPAR